MQRNRCTDDISKRNHMVLSDLPEYNPSISFNCNDKHAWIKHSNFSFLANGANVTWKESVCNHWRFYLYNFSGVWPRLYLIACGWLWDRRTAGWKTMTKGILSHFLPVLHSLMSTALGQSQDFFICCCLVCKRGTPAVELLSACLESLFCCLSPLQLCGILSAWL